MKKMISFVLCLLILCAVFSACTVKPPESDSPEKSSQENLSQENLSPENSSTVSSADGSTGGTDTEEKVIHLLTDMGHNAMRAGATYDQFNAQYIMDQFLSEMGELPEGYRLEVEVMPTEEGDFQSRLTRLRTEIMSGRGPDIYFLSSSDAAPFFRQERVFPNTKKTMEDGFFLPLDSYMDSAQFMEFEDMNPTVMAAGCTPEGRFVLPVRYIFGGTRVLEAVTDTGENWFDGINSTDEVLASSYAAAAHWLPYHIFAETVDTESKTLLFTEEELYDAVAMTYQWYGTMGTDFPKRETITTLIIDGNTYSMQNGADYEWDPELKDSSTYIPLRNREGGVTATVTSYLAISKDTLYPDEAFYIVDLMMSKKFQSGQKSWESGYHEPPSSAAVFSYSRGVSVYDDFLTKSRPMNYQNYVNDEMWPEYCKLRDQITDVRIMSSIDQELYEVFDHAWRESLTDGPELKKYVTQEYNKMVLMAGEL